MARTGATITFDVPEGAARRVSRQAGRLTHEEVGRRCLLGRRAEMECVQLNLEELEESARAKREQHVGRVEALDAAQAAGSTVIERLRSALPFVELANTDDDFMTEHAEAILMGSAFEQLLAGDASAYKLGKKFGEQFGQFGSLAVDEARKLRPDIQIDMST